VNDDDEVAAYRELARRVKRARTLIVLPITVAGIALGAALTVAILPGVGSVKLSAMIGFLPVGAAFYAAHFASLALPRLRLDAWCDEIAVARRVPFEKLRSYSELWR
jgi:hypothetical protein